MITNMRLLELRQTGLKCQEKVAAAKSECSQLEKDYALLYTLVCDGKLDIKLGMGTNIHNLHGK